MSVCLGGAGTRQIIVSPVTHGLYMASRMQRIPLADLKMKDVFDTLKSLSHETIEEFITTEAPGCEGKSALYHATVGPGDVLVLPAGWMFWERTTATDFIGIKASVLFKKDQVCLNKINGHLMLIKKPNTVTQAADDFLAKE